jgi:hypothetical protein
VTPVTTSAENAVDDKPVVSSSKEVANQTGLITHNEVSEIAYNKAIVITNELYTDIKDLPLGLRIQRLQLNNSETNETSQRLTALVGFVSLNSTFSSIIKDEHRDKPLQTHVDECVEQAGKDDQPYPSAPLASSDHLEAGSLNLSEHTADEPLPCFCSADD